MNDLSIKLQAYIAHNSQYSRRKAEELIKKGQVMVNNEVAHIGQRIYPQKDVVVTKGHLIKKQAKIITFLVNKPVGYVSTTDDKLGRKKVIDLIPKQPVRIYPVGRLDKDSQGLMILTNNGNLTYKFTHPKFGIKKTYIVTLDKTITDHALKKLKKGVVLEDGLVVIDSISVMGKEKGKSVLSITLHEGKNREVRRMMQKVRYEVTKLIRIKLGPYSLNDLHGLPFIKI